MLWCDDVAGSRFPVVANVFGKRERFALGLGVPEERLIRDWGVYGERRVAPVLGESGPVHEVVLTGAEVDLGTLPIMLHFDCDAGRYITNGIVVARDPDTGVRNASFHRMQVIGRTGWGPACTAGATCGTTRSAPRSAARTFPSRSSSAPIRPSSLAGCGKGRSPPTNTT